MGCTGLIDSASINIYRPVLTRTSNKPYTRRRLSMAAIRAESMATEKLGIFVEKNPPESKLTQLGVRNWPKYALLPLQFLIRSQLVHTIIKDLSIFLVWKRCLLSFFYCCYHLLVLVGDMMEQVGLSSKQVSMDLRCEGDLFLARGESESVP